MKKKYSLNFPYVLCVGCLCIALVGYLYLCFFPTQEIVRASVFKETELVDKIASPRMKHEIISHGSRTKKQVALTFDADMTEGMHQALQTGEVATYADQRVIDFLIENDIKSTIFLTGMWIETYPQETRMMAENPIFELANHSYSHPSFAGECYGLRQIAPADIAFELQRTQRLLNEITGKNNKYFRFPGGCYNQQALSSVSKEGMVTVHWDVIAHDGFNTDVEQIVTNVLNKVRNGSIIVMHFGGEANTPKTFEALQEITAVLVERGFTFVTVAELLDIQEQATSERMSSKLLQMRLHGNI